MVAAYRRLVSVFLNALKVPIRILFEPSKEQINKLMLWYTFFTIILSRFGLFLVNNPVRITNSEFKRKRQTLKVSRATTETGAR
jgi:hypothetical protein